MDIASILEIENKRDYKLHAARHNGTHEPLDLFLQDESEWDNWNKWRENDDDFNREYVVSFMKFYPEHKTWLFGGIYKILRKRPEKKALSYDIELTDKGKDLIGRLKITADIKRGRAFRLENCYDKLSFCEILRERYSGEVFCGYENISQDFSKLEVIFNNERKEWKIPLENVKGVYVISDKKTGRKYVGSASGKNGVWSRWAEYMSNGHGGNTELIKLIKDAGSIAYAREHFRITLIEYRPFKTDDRTIEDRESFWKEALLTRQHGYNAN